jgi:uncharacterized protein (DUF433 family)
VDPDCETFDVPMYSPAMASRLVGLESSRVRRWLQGYAYTYAPKTTVAKGRRRQSPLVQRRGALGSQYASFVDLIDLLFVKKFVEHGISVQRLRKALEEAVDLTGDHHFAQRRFWTDGRKIFLQIKDKPAEALLELLSGGQWVIAPIIKQVAHQIEFDAITGVSTRWFPLGKDKSVVVDPSVAFGAPTIAGRGVHTANVFDLYEGEGRNIGRVSAWLDLPQETVQHAVEFEQALAAA